MGISRKIRTALMVLAGIVVIGLLTVWMSLPRIERWGVGFHQKSVTRSLADWGRETATITNDASAIHAAEMIGYMSSYYVPGPGYRGPDETEAALEQQRRESIELVVAALQRYTGLDYGADPERWIEWAGARKSSEPDR